MSDPDAPQNSLYDRYASREMARLFSPRHRYGLWRRLWIVLADTQRELGLPIRPEQIRQLEEAAPRLDLGRVAELEAETRHDVVAHLRHFAEQAPEAGGILHLGATSAFVTDNADGLIQRDALALLVGRLGAAIAHLADFARRTRSVPALAYTHFQPAQLTTVGKRATLWLQDLCLDLEELRHRQARLRLRGVKGTTGTQASFLQLFGGDHQKVRLLDRKVAERLGMESILVSGQTYTRKQDSQVLAAFAGIAESCHKMGTDLRLLQGVGELSEPFGSGQVGSSAMAYKRNPVRAERMCSLARRLMTDALNGPLTTATQWLERSLDDSANRRLVLTDANLTADAVLGLAGYLAQGIVVHESTIRARVERELPFMATESILMEATLRGGDRQALHERLRQLSLEAHEAVAGGGANPLLAAVGTDPAFNLGADEVRALVDPQRFTGRSAAQVDEFLEAVVQPLLDELEPAAVEAPRV